jgi:Fungal specific transcription factor domain
MSFNAPFTTLGYYSWLFENDNLSITDSTLVSIPSQPAGVALGENSLTIPHGKGYYPDTNLQIQDGLPPTSLNSDISVTSNATNDSHVDTFTLPNAQTSQGIGNPLNQHNRYSSTPLVERHAVSDSHSGQLHHDMYQTAGNLEYSPSTSANSDHSDPITINTGKSTTISASLSSHDWSSSVKSSTSQISSPPDQRSALRNGHPLPDAYTAQPGSKLPLISSKARDGLMREINQSHPTRPDGSEISSSDPLLSLSSLQHYSDLFFTRFNSSYPLIHQATFDSNNVHNFLLMSILLLGATYSDKEAHLLAICIHDIMRPLIHSSKEFSTRPKLWMLQAILLVECFGKSRAGEKQHDMR